MKIALSVDGSRASEELFLCKSEFYFNFVYFRKEIDFDLLLVLAELRFACGQQLYFIQFFSKVKNS